MSNLEASSQMIKNKFNNNPKIVIQSELKLGEYFLTPLESFIINKSMPYGFKLELEENIVKFSEDKKKNKKYQNIIKTSNYILSNNNNHNKINNKIEKRDIPQTKKRINQDFNLDNIPTNINREKYKIAKKCKIGMERLKESPLVKNFYEFNDTEIPSLSKVEKKINNYEYNSFYDFEMDIRKIWSYFFYIGEKGDKQIYEYTSKMSEKFENICSELENANDDIHDNVSNSVTRRAEKNRKELLEYKENGKEKNNINSINHINKKDTIIKNGNTIISNGAEPTRTMTSKEKNKLAKLIKYNLKKEQLKGIAKILMGNDNIKILEFDIDQLPYDKLKNLEKYIYDCVEKNNLEDKKNGGNKINNINNNSVKKEKENDINDKNIIHENGAKKIEDKIEETDNNEKIENKTEINKENGINKNKENENNNNISNEPLNNKKNDSLDFSDLDSSSSDSSLSD